MAGCAGGEGASAVVQKQRGARTRSGGDISADLGLAVVRDEGHDQRDDERERGVLARRNDHVRQADSLVEYRREWRVLGEVNGAGRREDVARRITAPFDGSRR